MDLPGQTRKNIVRCLVQNPELLRSELVACCRWFERHSRVTVADADRATHALAGVTKAGDANLFGPAVRLAGLLISSTNQVPVVPKVTNIGSQIFVTCTFYILLLLQYSLV
jgi:hypothetical protein